MLLSKALRTDARVHMEATALQEAGHQVVVLEWGRFEPDAPTTETIDGIDVVRFHGGHGLRSIPTSLLKMPLWWRAATRVVEELHQNKPFDVVHAHDLDTLPIAVRWKNRGPSRQVVFDAHEVYPLLVRSSHGAIIAAAAERLERRLLTHVDQLITCSDALADHYRQRTDVPVHVVWNAFFDAPSEPTPFPSGSFTVGYVGTLTRDRFMPEAVHVISNMPDVAFRVGGKPEGAYERVRAACEGHPSVTFLGTLPHGHIESEAQNVHAILSFQDPRNRQYRIQVTNKLFEAMAAGRAVIAAEGTGPGHFVERHGIGVVRPYGADGLRSAVEHLQGDSESLAQIGQRGLALARSTYNRTAQIDTLLVAYKELGD